MSGAFGASWARPLQASPSPKAVARSRPCDGAPPRRAQPAQPSPAGLRRLRSRVRRSHGRDGIPDTAPITGAPSAPSPCPSNDCERTAGRSPRLTDIAGATPARLPAPGQLLGPARVPSVARHSCRACTEAQIRAAKLLHWSGVALDLRGSAAATAQDQASDIGGGAWRGGADSAAPRGSGQRATRRIWPRWLEQRG